MVSINFKKWMMFVLGVILAISKSASAQLQCILPNNEEGACVKIPNCPWLVEAIFFKRVVIHPYHIRNLYCGKIDGRVAICCSNGDRHVENSNGVDIFNHHNLHLLPTSDCGPMIKTKLPRTDKIVLSEMPWIAKLQYETFFGLKILCEGSIINNRYILTAARCFLFLWENKVLISVILGEHDPQTKVDYETHGTNTKCNPRRQEFLIEKTITHHKFNQTLLSNDIGLIRLLKPIIFDQDHIQPVCLPTSSGTFNLEWKEIFISGLERRSNKVLNNTSSKVHFFVQDMEICRKKYEYFQFADDKQFCAHEEGSEDSCGGIPGSTLVHPFDSNGYKYFQFGMFSYGPSNCKTGPGIYVNIQKYMDWILDNIEP